MQEPSVIHGTFVIRRSYSCAPAKVFTAFADKDKKRRWFVEGPGFAIDSFEMDFRIGGTESCHFRYIGDGPIDSGTPMGNDTWYLDIVPDQRIVTAYNMTRNGKSFSSSLATIDILKTDKGCDVLFTEQGAYFDGADGVKMREEGWKELLGQLEKELAR